MIKEFVILFLPLFLCFATEVALHFSFFAIEYNQRLVGGEEAKTSRCFQLHSKYIFKFHNQSPKLSYELWGTEYFHCFQELSFIYW